MFKNKIYIFIIVGTIILLGLLALLYFLPEDETKNSSTEGGYPVGVLDIIKSPAERINDNFNHSIVDDKYVISYGGDLEQGTFFITVNAEPVVEVSKMAEKVFLEKLEIDETYACELYVVLNVPSTIDSDLADYDFGLSFCPGRIHIEDVPRKSMERTRYYDDSDSSSSTSTNQIR